MRMPNGDFVNGMSQEGGKGARWTTQVRLTDQIKG